MFIKFTPLLFVGALLAGCATHRDDARLQGTWFLNQNATVPATSNIRPRTAWVTYRHGAEFVVNANGQYGHPNVSFHYYVVEHGSNYVVIRTTAPLDKGRDIHIRFLDANKSYWIDSGPWGYGIQERFDQLQPKSLPPGMGGVIPPEPIPLDL
ncbi:MAG TPA: hypothetical protein VNZ25_10295 [Candidatus Angelobacter sp.]|jgi:hypothetical protein|nr:hypothetical protein [Candidatus Angelobacter sp.]